MRQPVLITLVAALAAVATGCTRGGAPGDGRLSVVATTTLVADLARELAGERAAVTALMGPGVDPHLYKAREGDVLRLAGADLVLYSGLHLEAKMGDVLERLQGRMATAAVTDGIPRDRLLAPAEFAGAYDPHVWFDVGLWSLAAGHAAEALAARDPAGAETYRERLRGFQARLAELDAWVRERAGTLPPERRVLVTAHDAFNYFGRAYGFEVRGLQGISTAAEAGTADVQRLAAFVAERRIPALFVESSVSPRTIRAVQAAVEARGFAVRIGGQLYSDALGAPGSPGADYVGMVRANVDAIVEALGERSDHGR